ncbi:MAG: carboxypeptidase regulatory-like domain-containing protein [Patescibacteria group bacterium]|jgi:hypothetical protein
MKKWLVIPMAMIGVFVFAQVSWAASTINGQIFNTVGETVTGAECSVSLLLNGGGVDTTTTSAVDGTFVFTVAAEGEYSLYFSSGTGCELQTEGYNYGNYSFYVKDGLTYEENVYVNLVDQQGTVRGKIIDEDGAPRADDYVSILRKEAESDNDYYSGQTDSTGKFNISNIAPGTYEIIINSYDGNTMGVSYRNFVPTRGDVIDLGDISFTVASDSYQLSLLDENFSPLDISSGSAIAYALIPDEDNPGSYLPSGPYAQGTCTDATCSFTLNDDYEYIINVVARVGTKSYYGSIVMPAGTTASDFVMTERFDLDDVTGSNGTFSSQSDYTITMSDGTQIAIPAYAIDEEAGDVSVIAEAAFDLPVIDYPIEGFSYNFTAYDTNNNSIKSFNRPLSIEFSYDSNVVAQLGLTEEDLIPAYYDEEDNRWFRLLPQQYSVDTTNDTVSMQVNHFSQYALIADRVDDITSEYSAGNEEAITRKPTTVKEIQVPRKKMRLDEAIPWHGQVYISWKKKAISKAQKYVVQVQKNNSNKKTLFTFDNRKTIRNHMKNGRIYFWLPNKGHDKFTWQIGKNYTFKVKAYNYVDETWFASDWSDPTTALVSPL